MLVTISERVAKIRKYRAFIAGGWLVSYIRLADTQIAILRWVDVTGTDPEARRLKWRAGLTGMNLV